MKKQLEASVEIPIDYQIKEYRKIFEEALGEECDLDYRELLRRINPKDYLIALEKIIFLGRGNNHLLYIALEEDFLRLISKQEDSITKREIIEKYAKIKERAKLTGEGVLAGEDFVGEYSWNGAGSIGNHNQEYASREKITLRLLKSEGLVA